MCYFDEASCTAKTVSRLEIMNAVSEIANRLQRYKNCLVAIALDKHPALVSAVLGYFNVSNFKLEKS